MWLFNRDEAQGVLTLGGPTEWAGLAELCDASHSYNWRLFLPLCKACGLFMVCVHADKPLTVIVKQSNLPVMVFSPLVFRE
jgi:hypothetical protein